MNAESPSKVGFERGRTTASAAWYPRKQIGEWALLAITGLALYLCWLLAKPFLAAVAWALALAIVVAPAYRIFERAFRPNLAAFITTLSLAFVLLAPGAFLLHNIYTEASSSLTTLGNTVSATNVREAAGRYSFTHSLLEWLDTRFDLDQELKRAATALASQVPAALTGSTRFVSQFAMMLLFLFYFLRDRARLLEMLGKVLPLSEPETGQFFSRISETIYATLYGNLMVKLVQGTLGGLMFWILGLPAPALFGAAMALLAMVPMIGTSLIWGPAAIYLAIHGSWIQALVLACWGAFVVSIVDNLLYPIIVGSQLRFHTLAVLVAVFGGLIAFGIAGVILGPVILASTVALLDVWRRRYSQQ